MDLEQHYGTAMTSGTNINEVISSVVGAVFLSLS